MKVCPILHKHISVLSFTSYFPANKTDGHTFLCGFSFLAPNTWCRVLSLIAGYFAYHTTVCACPLYRGIVLSVKNTNVKYSLHSGMAASSFIVQNFEFLLFWE